MSRRVLVVEDSPDNRALLLWLLEDLDCVCLEAEDGGTALRAFGDGSDIDLVLLDIDLPDISGIELAPRLRAATREGRVPIVAQTAHAIPDEIERIEACGVDAVLTKPLDEDRFFAVLGELLGDERTP